MTITKDNPLAVQVEETRHGWMNLRIHYEISTDFKKTYSIEHRNGCHFQSRLW